MEAPSREKTVFPRAWKLCQEEKQYFHKRGNSVKEKNSTSTSVEAPSRRKTVLPQVWKLRQGEKQYFHECGSSVKKKNNTSTSVEALSNKENFQNNNQTISKLFPDLYSSFCFYLIQTNKHLSQ